jgi:ribokinase
MLGCVGNDNYGDLLIENLEKNQVETRHILRKPGVSTGIASITVDHQGGNSIIVVPGANFKLKISDLDRMEAVFRPGGILVIQLEIPLEVVNHAIYMAKKHEMTVILNPAPALPLPVDIYPRVDYLIPNENELTSLVDDIQMSVASIPAMARKLQQSGLHKLILTRGEAGALFITPGQERTIPAFPVVPVDTTAAGDAFIGGFATGLSEGMADLEAIQLGSAAGALAATRPGAQTSLPTRLEVVQFLGTHTSTGGALPNH